LSFIVFHFEGCQRRTKGANSVSDFLALIDLTGASPACHRFHYFSPLCLVNYGGFMPLF
jgi:hypothetical protein